MMITIAVSDELVRRAQDRGQDVVSYVEALIDKGMTVATAPPVLDNAMDRIRALRGAVITGTR